MLLKLTKLILKILILLIKKYKVKFKIFDKTSIGIEEYKNYKNIYKKY